MKRSLWVGRRRGKCNKRMERKGNSIFTRTDHAWQTTSAGWFQWKLPLVVEAQSINTWLISVWYRTITKCAIGKLGSNLLTLSIRCFGHGQSSCMRSTLNFGSKLSHKKEFFMPNTPQNDLHNPFTSAGFVGFVRLAERFDSFPSKNPTFPSTELFIRSVSKIWRQEISSGFPLFSLRLFHFSLSFIFCYLLIHTRNLGARRNLLLSESISFCLPVASPFGSQSSRPYSLIHS